MRTVAQIVEQSLRLIGAVSPYEEASDSSYMDIGIQWFDMVKANLIATEHFWFFNPASQFVKLEATKSQYDLNTLLDEDLQFITEVRLYNNDKLVGDMPMLLRHEYEQYIGNNSAPETPSCYITLSTKPIMTIIPTPILDTMKVELVGQVFSKDVTRDLGKISHDFMASWELYLVHELAKYLGNGVILQLRENQSRRIDNEARNLFTNLNASRSNGQQRNKPRKTQAPLI